MVSDNGPGIPAEHLPHVFERFYRQEAARSREEHDAAQPPSGSGLGLAIVQSIVQSYGGEVAVESQPGQGSSFTVWLPGPSNH
jgi:signal transduction histidine kinase